VLPSSTYKQKGRLYMKLIIATLLTFSSLYVFAADLTVTSCADYSVSLNSVYSMKTYANGSVKIFGIDMVEPAAAPAGVAIAIDRGDDLSTMESFCRYIPGFSSVDISSSRAKFNKSTNTLTLTLKASQTDKDGVAKSKVLTVSINKGASNEADLVKALLQ
jgi:hypothetical protein